MMTLTRKRQTFLLILLTAATLMPSYSLQGWLAGGHSAAELPFWFWIWETVAWSARALIEAGAILFLFETNAQTHTQERGLLFFKIALIVLITLTLGVVVGAAGLGQSIADALPRPLYWLWSFAVASYAPLMLGSVGMAYRIQPHDTSDMMTQEPDAIASKPIASPRPMTQPKKQIASKVVDALPDANASSRSMTHDAKVVDALPDANASSRPMTHDAKVVDALSDANASSRPMTHDAKANDALPEPVASPRPMTHDTKVGDALPEPFASPRPMTHDAKANDALPDANASPRPMTHDAKANDALPDANASPRPMTHDAKVGDALPPENVSPELFGAKAVDAKKLWNTLDTLEQQYMAYQDKKGLGFNDDDIAVELGVSRSTINRMKQSYTKKYPVVAVTNGVHK